MRKKGSITLLYHQKKDGKQRLLLDCRPTTRPSHQQLFTEGSLDPRASRLFEEHRTNRSSQLRPMSKHSTLGLCLSQVFFLSEEARQGALVWDNEFCYPALAVLPMDHAACSPKLVRRSRDSVDGASANGLSPDLSHGTWTLR